MSVSIKSYTSSGYCAFCSKLAKFKVVLDGIDLIWLSCADEIHLNRCVDRMNTMAEKLGHCAKSSKREKTPEPAPDIPYMLENWGKTKLTKLSKAQLVDLCVERDIPKSGSKGEIASNLIKWKNAGGVWISRKGGSAY